MHIIRDTDTVEFIDGSGDKLVLLSAPRRRDVIACDEIEESDAFAYVEKLKSMGVDVTDLAAKAREARAAAKATDGPAPADSEPDGSAKLRQRRLKALAVALFVNGDKIGGDAIIDAYLDMDDDDAAWIDAQVASVWDKATVSDASARGKDADAGVSPVVSAAE